MKRLAVRSRYRVLGIVLALGLTVAALTSPVKAVGDWSGCGEPYIRTIEHTISLPFGIFSYTWFEYQACANCEQGTACFAT